MNVQFELPGRQLTTEASLPGVGSFTLALLRPKDIVKMVASGEIPLGITGQDTVEEYRLSLAGEVQTLLPLGIGRCRDEVRDAIFKVLLARCNPDAIQRKARINELIALVR